MPWHLQQNHINLALAKHDLLIVVQSSGDNKTALFQVQTRPLTFPHSSPHPSAALFSVAEMIGNWLMKMS